MTRRTEIPAEQKQLRLRVFAGPNGSGKSTVIEHIQKTKVNGKAIDFGLYINADEIATLLRAGKFSFDPFTIQVANKDFRETVCASGLINPAFTQEQFEASYSLRKNILRSKSQDQSILERLAQIIADYLRKKLLQERKRFSFETVFSHPSKLNIMRDAVAAGYKVYLYFVSTESPTINVYRVNVRVALKGHHVEEQKIKDRYYRSLSLLYDACQIAYQAYLFDNSVDGRESLLFAHFKIEAGRKKWDNLPLEDYPQWFKTYYSGKIS